MAGSPEDVRRQQEEAKTKEEKNKVDPAAGTTNLISPPIPPKQNPDDLTTLESATGEPSPTPPAKPFSEKGDPDALKGSKDFWERLAELLFAVANTKTGKMFAEAGKKLWEKTPESIKKPIVKTGAEVNKAVNKLVVKPGKWVGNKVVAPIVKGVGGGVIKGVSNYVIAPAVTAALSPIKGIAHLLNNGPTKSVKHASEAIVAKKEEIKEKYDAKKEAYHAKKAEIKEKYDVKKEEIKEKYDATKDSVKAGYDATKQNVKAGYDATKQGVKVAGSAISNAATKLKEKCIKQKEVCNLESKGNSLTPAHNRQMSMSNSVPNPPDKKLEAAARKTVDVGVSPPPSSRKLSKS